MTRYLIAEWIRQLRLRLHDPARRPLPEVTAETGPTLRGWVLRLALLALTPALLLTAASRSPGIPDPMVWTLVLLCTGLLVARPTPTTAGGVVVLSGVLLWGLDSEPFDPWSLLVALLAYLLSRATWWAAHLPPRSRAEIAALLVGWRRDLAVLGGTGLLGGLAMLTSGAALPGAVLLAALAVVGIAFLALATGGSARDDGRS
ncbi:hypothetical protein [Promicromonospora panici]|uniref:hypothetical protein n=1 Tax=Promicromonospora panici TaxID=2219658 RepID=UPI00101BFFF6|nr:hypothetical protein [Promicromonospora panici]